MSKLPVTLSDARAVTTFDEADAVARYQALVKVEIKNRQKANDQRLARALIVADAKRSLKPSAYKDFLTKIECADSTSRELLKIAKAGDPAEVRRATALRVADHRARKGAVTSSKVTAQQVEATYNATLAKTGSHAQAHLAVLKISNTIPARLKGITGHDRDLLACAYRTAKSGTEHVHLVAANDETISAAKAAADAWTRAYEHLSARSGTATAMASKKHKKITAAEGVLIAASHGAVVTEPEVAEWLKLADMSPAAFEKHVKEVAKAAAIEAPSITPEPESSTLLDADVWALIQPILDFEKAHPLTVESDDKYGPGFEIVGGTIELHDALATAAMRLIDFEHYLRDHDEEVSAQISDRYDAQVNLAHANLAAARKAYKAATGKAWGGGRNAELIEWYDAHNDQQAKKKPRR
jgi:hypothetical protein